MPWTPRQRCARGSMWPGRQLLPRTSRTAWPREDRQQCGHIVMRSGCDQREQYLYPLVGQKTGSIRYIDQTLLPNEERIVECRSVRRLAKAIQRLEIRGAPALGVAGAFGVALAASLCRKKTTGTISWNRCHAMQRCSGPPARLQLTSGGGLTVCWTR